MDSPGAADAGSRECRLRQPVPTMAPLASRYTFSSESTPFAPVHLLIHSGRDIETGSVCGLLITSGTNRAWASSPIFSLSSACLATAIGVRAETTTAEKIIFKMFISAFAFWTL